MNGLHPDAGPRTRTPRLMQGPHARPPPLPAWRPPKVSHTHLASLCYISQAIVEAAAAEGRKWVSGDSRRR